MLDTLWGGGPPFKLKAQNSLKMLSITALLIALKSAKRLNDLCTLLVSPLCCSNEEDRSNFTASSLMDLRDFGTELLSLRSSCFPPHVPPTPAGARFVSVCFGIANIRRTQQLFAHYRGHSQAVALSKQRLSCRLCDATTQAYSAAGEEPPQGSRPTTVHESLNLIHGSS